MKTKTTGEDIVKNRCDHLPCEKVNQMRCRLVKTGVNRWHQVNTGKMVNTNKTGKSNK